MPTLDLFDVHLIGLWPCCDVGQRSSLAPGNTKSRSAGGCAIGIDGERNDGINDTSK